MIHSVLSLGVAFFLLHLGEANLVTHVKHERSYNDVDFFEFETLKSLTSALFNEDGRIATTNVLLGNYDCYGGYMCFEFTRCTNKFNFTHFHIYMCVYLPVFALYLQALPTPTVWISSKTPASAESSVIQEGKQWSRPLSPCEKHQFLLLSESETNAPNCISIQREAL